MDKESIVNRPLTGEERQKVEDNNKLIEGFLHKYRLDHDTYYGAAAEGLIHAAKKFDKTRGSSFSTYAYAAMRSYCNAFYTRVEKNFLEAVSLDAQISETIDKDGEIFYLNTISGNFNTTDDMILYIEYKEKIKVLNSYELQLLIGLLRGRKMSEIAVDYGVTRSYIQSRVSKIRKKLTHADKMNSIMLNKAQDKFMNSEEYIENYNKACKELSKVIFK